MSDADHLEDRDQLAVRYRGIATRVAARMHRHGCGADFEDIEAAAWVGVLEGARAYNPTLGKLATHLFVCAINAARKHLLKASRHGIRHAPRAVRLVKVGGEAVSAIAARPPEDRPERWSDSQWETALAELRPSDRDLVRAFYCDGIPQTKLIGRFGPTRGAVNVRLGGLRSKLRNSSAFLSVASSTGMIA